MIRKILVVTLLVALNNTVSCMLLVPTPLVKSRTVPASLRIAGRNKTPKDTRAIALLPLAKSGHIVPSCTVAKDLAQLRISDDTNDDAKDDVKLETDRDKKSPLFFDYKQEQLQAILYETKAQLLLVLFLSLHSKVDKDTWTKTPFDPIVKKRDHPDIFAMLSNFGQLTTCKIDNDQWYSSSISIETLTVRRWIATALIEIAIALDVFVGQNLTKVRQSKDYEFFTSQLGAYQKSHDFSHKQSPNFDEDQLLLLLRLNKALMNTCFEGKLEYQTSKHNEMLSYCETDCPTIDRAQLQESFQHLTNFKMSMYKLVVQYVAAGRYDA